ncbi:unnamed protein product [Brassica oleracea var. botrytis]
MPYLRLISVDFVLSKNRGRSKTEHKPLTTRKQILRLFFFFFFFFLFILRRMVDSGHDNDIRCHHCAGPLTKTLETSEWTVSPFIRDSFSMIGSAVGGTASAFIGFNHVMPIVRKWIKGPMWLHFLVGAPPVIVLSSACAGLAGLSFSSPPWHCTGAGTAGFIFIPSSSPFISATAGRGESQNAQVYSIISISEPGAASQALSTAALMKSRWQKLGSICLDYKFTHHLAETMRPSVSIRVNLFLRILADPSAKAHGLHICPIS